MSSFGVLSTGFKQKTIDDILSEVIDDERAAFGSGINTLATSVLGQLNSIFADKAAELWELAAAVYNSQYPASATGLSLDNVAAITGVTRLAATQSTATLSLNLDNGVTVPAGSLVSIGDLGAQFATTAAVTNATGVKATVSVTAQAVDYGPIQALAYAIDTIKTPVSGWTAKAALTNANAETYNLAGGETLTVKVDGGGVQTVTILAGDITVGAATAAQVAAKIDATLTGASAFAVGTKVRIESDTDGAGSAIEVTGGTANAVLGFSTTKVAGLNQSDAAIGRNLETDSELRIRRELLLRAQGNAALESIRADVLEVDKVLQALVLQNVTNATDGNGLPPHSIEVIIDDENSDPASNTAVATAIFNSVAAGIETHATSPNDTTVVLTDSQGFSQTIKFTRAADLPLYITVTVTGNSTKFTSNANAQTAVKNALVAAVAELGIGSTVIYEKLKCACFDVDGITDINSFGVDTDGLPGTGTSNIVPTFRQKAVLDTANIAVTVLGVP